MARLTSAEIAHRLNAAREEGKEPTHEQRQAQKVRASRALSRTNAIIERRAGFKQVGFTSVELVIVVAIVVLLAVAGYGVYLIFEILQKLAA